MLKIANSTCTSKNSLLSSENLIKSAKLFMLCIEQKELLKKYITIQQIQ